MADGGSLHVHAFEPGQDTERELRDALGRFATGICVVTTQTADGPLGITANSFASVSLDPPLVLWSPALASKRCDAFVNADHFAIHILGEEQKHYCDTFATGGRDFDQLDWQPSAQNVPLLTTCLARFECDRYAVHDGGDHAIIIGKVTSATVGEGAPLIFAQGAYGRFAKME